MLFEFLTMLKSLSELKGALKSEIDQKVKALTDKQLLVCELKNDAIASSWIAESWKNLANSLGMLHQMKAHGELQTYSNKELLTQDLEKSSKTYFVCFEKYVARDKATKVSKKDAKPYIVKCIVDMLNAIKGGKYEAQDIEDLKEADQTLKEFSEVSVAKEAHIENGTFTSAEAVECFKRYNELKPQAEAKRVEIEALLGKAKPSNFTSEQVSELEDFFKEAIEKLVALKSSKNNGEVDLAQAQELFNKEVNE